MRLLIILFLDSMAKKKLFLIASLFFTFHISLSTLHSQSKVYSYDSVAGDPLHGRIYHLDNGLTVFISVNRNEPKIQTIIGVKAGSIYDPPDATGLAHYLEHMLFKGTTHFGTTDYAKEKPLTDEIENLFELYRHSTDEDKRKRIYRKIDSISNLASHYAIANEYTKMMKYIGAEGTNAHTSEDRTQFEENIPSNELDTWLQIESERFSNPVMRLFHTELEVVYEEKNLRLDDRSEIVHAALMNGLFGKHPYGSHTVLGSIHDLKNPSLKDIITYFHTYYVPNNMAIALCGDVDPDYAIEEVHKYFGKYVSKPLSMTKYPMADSITQPIIREIPTNGWTGVCIGFRAGGENTHDADMLELIQEMLYNSETGLLNKDRTLWQSVGEVQSQAISLKDYSYLVIGGRAVEKRTDENVKDSLINIISKLKKGSFPQWLIEGSVNNLRVKQMNDFHANFERAQLFINAFACGESWDNCINRLNRISKIRRNELIAFARNTFKDNYTAVFSKPGIGSKSEKITKPHITPVQTNPDTKSEFLVKIENEKTANLKPLFADYENGVRQYELKPGLSLYYVKNGEDSLFSLSYIYDMGSCNDRRTPYALQGLYNGSTSYFSSEVIKEEFFRMGCNYVYSVDEKLTTLHLKGLAKNFTPALNLLESMLSDISFGSDGWDKFTQSMAENRKIHKKDIDWYKHAMSFYVFYGPLSPFTYVFSDEEINSLKPQGLQNFVHNLRSRPHKITYYGPENAPQLLAKLEEYHKTPDRFLPILPAKEFVKSPLTNRIYIINTDLRDANIYIYQQGIRYNPLMEPVIALYNEYFGGGMGSLLMQSLRESKALSYTPVSSYKLPDDSSDVGFNQTIISTQLDKLGEMLEGAMHLLNDTLPFYPQLFLTAKDAVLNSISSKRISREELFPGILKAEKRGISYDINKTIYENVPNLSFADISAFHNKYIAHQPFAIVIFGNPKAMDIPALANYGKISFPKAEELFGY